MSAPSALAWMMPDIRPCLTAANARRCASARKPGHLSGPICRAAAARSSPALVRSSWVRASTMPRAALRRRSTVSSEVVGSSSCVRNASRFSLDAPYQTATAVFSRSSAASLTDDAQRARSPRGTCPIRLAAT